MSSVRSYEETYGVKYPQSGQITKTDIQKARIKTFLEETPMLNDESAEGGGVNDLLQRMKMSQTTVLRALRTVREPLVDYQESRGVPRNESISFVTLLTSLCTHAYTAALTILVMLWNLAPLLDGFIYFARFMLDKLIDIVETNDRKDQVIKILLFFFEIIVVTILLFLIIGLIFMPVLVLTTRIFGKIWSMIAW